MTGEQQKVLVIDDDAMTLKVLSMMLGKYNFEVLFTDDFDILFDPNSIEGVRLILMDVHLKDVSGVALLDKIQRVKHLKHVPVIMMTSSDDYHLLEACFELGAYDYIIKPCEEHILVSRIKSAIMKAYRIQKMEENLLDLMAEKSAPGTNHISQENSELDLLDKFEIKLSVNSSKDTSVAIWNKGMHLATVEERPDKLQINMHLKGIDKLSMDMDQFQDALRKAQNCLY